MSAAASGGLNPATSPLPTPIVESAIRWATEYLRDRGVPEAGLEAQLLLGHLLGRTRAQVLAHPAAPLSQVDLTLFAALVGRRGRREPYAYLVGSRHWLDLQLTVDRNVLIPRPETEQLAELAIAAAGRLVESGIPHPVVIDVGIGSGALAIALARACPTARVIGTDSSDAALVTAARNVARLAPGLVHLHHSDLLSGVRDLPHLVVANLPYIPTADLAALQPELAYEPRQALDGGLDGLDAIRALLAQAPSSLQPGGMLLIECGHDQADRVVAVAATTWPSVMTQTHPDLAGIKRFVEIHA